MNSNNQGVPEFSAVNDCCEGEVGKRHFELIVIGYDLF
jgi:hypothetical protein